MSKESEDKRDKNSWLEKLFPDLKVWYTLTAWIMEKHGDIDEQNESEQEARRQNQD